MNNTPKRKIFSVMVTTGLILATIASIGFYFVRSQNTTRAKLLNQSELSEPDALQEMVPTATDVIESAGQMSEEIAFKIQKQTIDDVTVEVTYVKKIETGVEIGICFTTLDDGEWYPGPGFLEYGEEKFAPDEAGLIREVHADGKNSGIRCMYIRYRIEDPEKITLPIQFTMRDVYMLPREIPACQNLQYRLDTNPKAQAYGITVNCTGGEQQSDMSVQLADFSKSTTQEEAQKVLDGIVAGEVSGPWEFTIDQIE